MNIWVRVFLPFAAGYFLSYLLRTVNAVIAPELARELSLTAADLGLLTSAYLLTFAAFQIPLGVLLDRYGPRRVEAALMLIAAAGTLLFAFGTSTTQLTLARGLIGLGVSACLMAAFKGFAQNFPPERQASLTGAIMASGGLGAVSASLPLEFALPLFGWRGVFQGLTFLLVAVAALIFFSVPQREAGVSRDSLGTQLKDVAGILANRVFWRYAPPMALITGGFMAVQGLWAVPWLMNVDGLSRHGAAEVLFALNLAMLVSHLGIATFATRLARAGIRPQALLVGGYGLALAAQAAMVVGLQPALPMWFAYGVGVSGGSLAYALLAGHFDPALSGRVTTALNLLAFVGAFSLQWGLGLLIDGLAASGLSTAAAYRGTFILLVLLQAASYTWFLLEGRRR
ncbi:MAG: MFS transporter [Betaproteobacteria bacterium]|nr:MFS transporter [Betaproteobacteria bacterium]